MQSTYKLDAKQGRFTVQVTASGVLKALGHNPLIAIRKFDGAISFDPDAVENNSLQLTVKPDSLEVTGDIKKSDRDEIEKRMRDEVLEVAAHPEISYRSKGIAAEKTGDTNYRLTIDGDLSLHGVTQEHRVEAQAKVRSDEIRLTGEFTLRQSDYKIKPVTALAGALKVKDELSFSFDTLGVKE